MKKDYTDFLKSKVKLAEQFGFDVEDEEINPILKPFQRQCVRWAVRMGRCALFESFGLGKSIQQLEILRLIIKRVGGMGLIVIPLGVRQEFIRDAAMLGIPVKFIRRIEEVEDGTSIYLTNYETVRDGKLDPHHFVVASLDEAAILRGFGGTKTFREFMATFAGDRKTMNERTITEGVKYRFVATATPSPNEYIELLAYSAFLGVMDVGAGKTRFFKRNSEKADQLTLHAHKEEEFWLWVASWALFVQKPSDLGCSDEGYQLPELDIHWHEIQDDHQDAGFDFTGQGLLLKQQALGVVESAREKRESLPKRIAKMMEIRAIDPDAHRIIWHDLEAERQAIEKAIPDVVSVYGAQDDEKKAENIIAFSAGQIRELAGKPVMLGAGVNFQRHCAWAIYLGIGHKFADFIQSVHRLQRFLQERRVRIDLIYTESEREVRRNLENKWLQHKEMVSKMTAIIKEYGLSNAAMAETLQRGMGVERIEVSGRDYRIINNDCVKEAAAMPDNSLDLILTSVPFSTQYEYSPNYCYDEQTEVLTRRGWLKFGDLAQEDQVATMNLETRCIEWQVPQRLVWMPYRGTMLHFRNRNNFDLLVTPDHKMIVDARVGNHLTGRKTKQFGGALASVIADDFVPRKWRMLNTATPGAGAEPALIEIPLLPDGARGPKRIPVSAIKPDDFMELAGWYLSEGYCDSLTSEHAGRITICQCEVNPDHRAAIASLFERIGLGVQVQERAIVAHNKGLAAFLLKQFGAGSYNKQIPRWIKDLHPRLLTILRDTMMKGDGNKDGFAYTSYSQRLRDDFQEICLLTGWRATIRGNVIRIGRKQFFPEVRERPAAVEYEGMVGCVTVPNGTVVIRRNGVACISGNCDFGHTDNNEHFFEQMDFLTPGLLRALKPGRIAAIHVKDRIVPGGMTGLGFQTVYPFHARCIEHYTRHGFGYMGMITIVTDVVRENNQTYRLGWSEVCKDGSKMSCGMPEYLLLFRKTPTDTTNSYADEPVIKSKETYSRSRWQTDAHGFWRSSGNRLMTPEELETLDHDVMFRWFRDYHLANIYDYEHHVKIGETIDACGRLPVTFMLLQPPSWMDDVWTDVARMRTLNMLQSQKGKEQHLCPLQFDICDRVIERFTNPGDTVFDPFSGIGSVGYRAILKGRKFVGTELSTRYFMDACHYLKSAENEMSMPGLFDTLEAAA